MQKVSLGITGEKISCMGLGTMYFGTRVNKSISFSILDYYYESGGRFLDSANKYASWVPGFKGGESELLIGEWLKQRGRRNDVFLSSKVGFPYGNIPRSLKKEIIISECERSLRRLGVETMDLYFAHSYDPSTEPEELMSAFIGLQEQGKIRFAGASNYLGWQLAEASDAAGSFDFEGFVCLQQRHTFLEPGMRADFGTQILLTPEIEDYCRLKNISLMAYSPLLGGAYVNPAREIPIQYQSAVNDFKMKNLKQLSEEMGVSANAVVLRWMMQSHPPVIPLVAGSSLNQLEENMEALNFTLSEEQLSRLNQELVKPEKYA